MDMDMTCFHTTQWTFPPFPHVPHVRSISDTPFPELSNGQLAIFPLCQTKQEKCTVFISAQTSNLRFQWFPCPLLFWLHVFAKPAGRTHCSHSFKRHAAAKKSVLQPDASDLARCLREAKTTEIWKNKKIDVLILETRKSTVVSDWLSITLYGFHQFLAFQV